MLIITLVSLALAVAAAVFAWRTRQEMARHAEARVALLMAELSAAPATDAVVPDGPPVDAEPQADAGGGAATTEPVPGLFGQRAAPKARAVVPPWAFAAGGAVLLVLGLVAASALTRAESGRLSARTADAASRLPLELVALEHARLEDAVVVSGRVRNPPRAAPHDQLAVVLLLVDAQDRVLSITPAPLELATLAPGAESPFLVRAARPAEASRVRVSFRQKDGHPAPHVDRRVEEVP